MDALQNLADVLVVIADRLKAKVCFDEDAFVLRINVEHPLEILLFLKSCYEELEIEGKEDLYNNLTVEGSAWVLAPDNISDIFDDIDCDAKKAELLSYVIKFYYSKWKNIMLLKGREIASEDKDSLRFLPMSVYGSTADMTRAKACGFGCCPSYDEIEARVLQEVAPDRTDIKNAYRIH
jgi:hypothetical protein